MTTDLTHAASNDHALVELWLGTKASKHTRRAYAHDAAKFLAYLGKPLSAVTMQDVQAFKASNRTLSAVKSLISFGHTIGYLRFDVGAAVVLSKERDTLVERILAEDEVHAMIAAASDPRDRCIVRLLYFSGVRVGELCSLRWRDCIPRDSGGQITVFGKGGKTRSVLLPPTAWNDLLASMRLVTEDESLVFDLHPSTVWRIVRRVATHAGVMKPVSPHWFRHAHASHALDHGAAIHLVQATLGHSSVATTGRYLHARPNESSASYLEG